MGHRSAWLVTVALLIVWLLLGSGCTAVYEAADTEDRWEVPKRFDRNDSAEDEHLIFVLRDRKNDISAIVHRTTPAFPDVLVPHFVAYQSERLRPDEPSSFEKTDLPLGWEATWQSGDGRWVRTYAFSGEEATYVLMAEGPKSFDDDEELFSELVAGFAPADEPRRGEELPTPALAEGVVDTVTVELEPLDADGNRRRATQIELNFSTLLTTGQLLHEPLPYHISSTQYLEYFLDRAGVEEAKEVQFEACDDRPCPVRSWLDGRDERTVYFVGVAVIEDQGFQIQLSAPAGADLEAIHHRLIREFMDHPQRLFDDEIREVGSP